MSSQLPKVVRAWCGLSAWWKLPRRVLGAYACGQSAWWKLPRGILGVWRLASGRLERPNNRGLWPECLVEAAAESFRGVCLWERWFRKVSSFTSPCFSVILHDSELIDMGRGPKGTKQKTAWARQCTFQTGASPDSPDSLVCFSTVSCT